VQSQKVAFPDTSRTPFLNFPPCSCPTTSLITTNNPSTSHHTRTPATTSNREFRWKETQHQAHWVTPTTLGRYCAVEEECQHPAVALFPSPLAISLVECTSYTVVFKSIRLSPVPGLVAVAEIGHLSPVPTTLASAGRPFRDSGASCVAQTPYTGQNFGMCPGSHSSSPGIKFRPRCLLSPPWPN